MIGYSLGLRPDPPHLAHHVVLLLRPSVRHHLPTCPTALHPVASGSGFRQRDSGRGLGCSFERRVLGLRSSDLFARCCGGEICTYAFRCGGHRTCAFALRVPPPTCTSPRSPTALCVFVALKFGPRRACAPAVKRRPRMPLRVQEWYWKNRRPVGGGPGAHRS